MNLSYFKNDFRFELNFGPNKNNPKIMVIFKEATQDLLLCFDNRTVKTTSKYALPEYLMTKCLEWDVTIQVNSCFYESHQHRGIQIADLLSSTIFQSYKNETKHFYNQLKIKKSIKFPYQHFGK